MNKAFVRESDATEVLCPLCGAAGIEVPRATAEHHVPLAALRPLAATVFFCQTPRCSVAYFDAFEAQIPAAELLRPVFPKAGDAPLCPCFGLTREDVAADADDTIPRRIRELLARSKTSAARCETASPTGRCCLPEVQRLYFKLKSG
ncbi:MAG: hypothetical protein SFU86_15865 [Pirellulaceae bacterium]|nr:hypothetical protein [Pirellulaceae bacterium]